MWPLDARLLAALREMPRHRASEELAAQLQTTPGELAERVEILRGAGFDVEHHPSLGYRLCAAADRLIADDLWARLGLPAQPGLVREILVLAETGSTNDVATRLGREGAEGGVLVIAEAQTAGRGRFGRHWASAGHRGIWMSLLLRPSLPVERWPRLTVWVAVALAAAVDGITGVRSRIKWPNDLQIGGKKVAGILIEMGAPPQPFAVVGLGVNVNHEPADFPAELAGLAQSLRMACGYEVDRAALLVALLCELEERWPAVEGDFASLVAEASSRSSVLGQWVRVNLGGAVREGVAEALDAEGHLLLRQADGELLRLTAGEVTLRIDETGASGELPAGWT